MRPVLLTLALLAACTAGDTPDLKDTQITDPDTDSLLEPGPELTAGAPRVGAAEGTLKLPVGTPLFGYTARCGCFSGRQTGRA